jgi:hypothetical protein
VQVETAWGRLQGGTTYVAIAEDRADFPFVVPFAHLGLVDSTLGTKPARMVWDSVRPRP